MPDKTLTIEQVLALLVETPSRLIALTAGLGPAQLRLAPGPDEWSANDILAHLRACADVWGRSITAIITQDRPTLRAISPRTWIKKKNYPEQEFEPSLEAFARQHLDVLAVLESQPERDWARTATIAGAGNVLEWSVLFYGQRLAGHERAHIKQIGRIVDTLRIEQA